MPANKIMLIFKLLKMFRLAKISIYSGMDHLRRNIKLGAL